VLALGTIGALIGVAWRWQLWGVVFILPVSAVIIAVGFMGLILPECPRRFGPARDGAFVQRPSHSILGTALSVCYSLSSCRHFAMALTQSRPSPKGSAFYRLG